MSRTVDNIIAYRIISMLVKPFKDTDAFKEGIIDEKGKILKKATKLTTTKEKNAYTFLHRLVFKLKQFVEKVPGGKSRLGSLAAASNFPSDVASIHPYDIDDMSCTDPSNTISRNLVFGNLK